MCDWYCHQLWQGSLSNFFSWRNPTDTASDLIVHTVISDYDVDYCLLGRLSINISLYACDVYWSKRVIEGDWKNIHLCPFIEIVYVHHLGWILLDAVAANSVLVPCTPSSSPWECSLYSTSIFQYLKWVVFAEPTSMHAYHRSIPAEN